MTRAEQFLKETAEYFEMKATHHKHVARLLFWLTIFFALCLLALLLDLIFIFKEILTS